MAEIFDFYVNDNRSITFKLSEPIMLEDNGVSDWRFHIPNTVNGLNATGWQWWLVYVNARNDKYTIPLTLEYDYDRPDAYSIATYTVDYGMSCKVGNVRFSLEAIDADTGGTILHEWHTKTYSTNVVDTLQGNQVEYAETESDIISALLIEVRNRTNQLIGGATPTPVSAVSEMLDTNKLYLLTTDGEWYYYNGTAWVSGGVYGAGVVDPVPTQGSTNAVQSGGVYSALDDLTNNAVFKIGTGQVTEQNTTFFTLSDNIYNYKTALSGKRLSSDGKSLIDSSAYVTSDYIDVSQIDYITGYRHNGNTLTTPTLEYAMYDSDFSVISGRGGKSGSVDVRGVSYIRFDGSDSIKNQYMIVDSSKTVTSYIPYETTFKYASDNVIHLTTADDIIQTLIDNAGSTFVFDNGNYDIIAIYESKYGSDYFTNYAGYSTNNVADRGLPVLRGTKIKCSQGAVFTCNYTGSNTSVRNNFSAFALESAVEINGLRLTASGIRNCIHDDFDNFYAGTTPTIIKNCILEHDRMVIAGGLAQHDIVIIENCIFNDTFVNHVSDFYYHNNLNGDAQSFMIIKDCYLNKGVGIKYYGSSTKMTDIIITNNSMANAIDFGANSGATVENMRIKEWNNVLRN